MSLTHLKENRVDPKQTGIVNIYITGFSGTGKSSVGREVARQLGWRFVDTDEEIIKAEGKSIESIFKENGEIRFRELESTHLATVSSQKHQIVSTGGGMVISEHNQRMMRNNGLVICLEASPMTIQRRLDPNESDSKDFSVRPLLKDLDPLSRICSLKSQRQVAYSQADWMVQTDRLTKDQVVKEVVRAINLLSQRLKLFVTEPKDELDTIVATSSGEYPVCIDWGILDNFGKTIIQKVSAGAAYIITDDGAHKHARRVQVSLETVGVPTHMFIVPQGEQSKSLEMAHHMYQWLAGRKAERGHLIVAVGGGVVGDLAGYVASTFLRGMPLVQVPTTLLAMMDSSIGGKTAVDLVQGKNLVGAFYNPILVFADVQTLQTLPQSEVISGWAEAIKHGLILDEGLVRVFEDKRKFILGLDRTVTTDVIRQSVAIKAKVVSVDEKETKGIRILLNYGHTIGHAIESVTSYNKFRHGEAVSIGMAGAADISMGMGLLSSDETSRQTELLESYGLPVKYDDIGVTDLVGAMSLDKKNSNGAIRWVLLERIGHAITRNDIPEQLVDQVLVRLERKKLEGS